MAEHVVVLLLENLASSIIAQAAEESWLNNDFKLQHQIQWIEGELRRMRCFLKDAESKQDRDERVKNWVADVRDVAYDTEDIVELFVFRKAQLRKKEVLASLRRYFLFFNELTFRRKLHNQIKGIMIRIQEISDSKSTYGIGNIGRGTEGAGLFARKLQEKRRSFPQISEDVVGLVEDVRVIESQLTYGESRRAVISIVGMAGIGKTTLAKKVYLNFDVQKHFDCCAWVCVSQDFGTNEILHELGKQLTGQVSADFGSESNEDLRERISNFLKNKRYLVVLDDIWNFEDWDGLRTAFPETNGSRILLTTRSKDVALYADPRSPPHELCLMNEEDSWELFSKLVCLERRSCLSLPPWAEELGKQILKKCGGLPLAIVVLGGLLSRKDATFNEWQKVLQSLHWQLRQEPMQCAEILALSYRDLPYYLKSCFLYFGLFSEDFEISARRLILLWVAEGFVLPRGDEPLEDVAEDYLEELVGRNMVQVAKRKSNGRIRTCRIHDLLRDLAISKAKEDHFLCVIHGETSTESLIRSRRVAIHSGVIPNTKHTRKIRSLLCFDPSETNFKQIRKLKLLRVLDLDGVYLCQLDSALGNLILLRFLSLRGTWLRQLPSSVGYLVNLEILDLRSTLISPIPGAIWRLKSLRVLYFNEQKEMIVNPLKDVHLVHLQTLRGLCIGRRSQGVDGLETLTNLRELELHGELHYHGMALAKWIHMSKNLEYLKLRTASATLYVEEGPDTFDFDRTCVSIPWSLRFADLYFLSKLNLEGFIKNLYDVEEFPPNLTELSLKGSYLREDPMPILEKLQNLRVLKLKQCSYVGKVLVSSNGGFPQLHLLKLSFLTFETLWIEEGGFRNLQQLEIIECQNMKILPRGLQPVSSLKDLKLGYMPHSFDLKLQDRKGENWYRIHHVPPI